MRREEVYDFVSHPPAIAFFVLFILLAFLADPIAFTGSWNMGRSALLAVVPLAALEMGKGSLARVREGGRVLESYLVVGTSAAYYVAVSTPQVNQAIVDWGVSLQVAPSIVQFSWVWGIDYAVSSCFLVALIFILAKPRIVTPAIYTIGMAAFLFIDVLLPENTLGPFGLVVPPTLVFVVFILNLTGMGTAVSQSNIMMLSNSQGSMNLQVFWPSAGLEGIVIAILVVAAVCVKLEVGWRRSAVYLLVGVVGSYAVNVIRLVLLALYAMSNITNPDAFQAFHSVAGDLVFIPWVVLYIIYIVRRERRLRALPLTAPVPRPGTPSP